MGHGNRSELHAPAPTVNRRMRSGALEPVPAGPYGTGDGPMPLLEHADSDTHFIRSFLMLLAGIIITIALFLSLPFTQLISERAMDRMIFVSTDRARPPPPPPPIDLKPREEVKREEEVKPELKKEVPKLTLSQLEAALNPGSGGTAFGDFSINFGALAAEDLSRIFELTEIDRAPMAIYQVEPIYPFTLSRSGVEGKATLRFVVTPRGNVTNIIVVSSSRMEFERPSIQAAEKWRFEPGVKAGTKVSVRMEQTFTFTLKQ